MEMNITKQAVTSNEVIFEQTVEQAIDTDFTIPDYCPGIVRIIKCRIAPRISSKNISGDMLTIDGCASITVIYSDEDNKICSYEHELDFQKILPIGEVGELPLVHISICQEYANCRAITQNKIDIHGVLAMKIKILCQKSIEILTDIDCEGVQIKNGSYPATNPLGCVEKIVVIEEDLELSKSTTTIKSILRSDFRAVLEQCKLIGNKAVVKGDILLNALYCTVQGTVEKYESRIPFNQIVDINIEGIDCECDAELKIMSCMLKPRTNLSGEAKAFAFECKLSILVFASCNNDIPVILDAFCTKHDLENKMCNVQFKKLESKLNERFMCEKTFDFPENTFGTVVDMWCENKVGQTKIENGQLMLNGTAIICLLVYDCDNQPQYFERSVDFEYTNNLNDGSLNSIPEANVVTASCAYTVIGDNKLETRVELCINAQIYKVKEEAVIINTEINSNPSNNVKKSPMIVYYATAGENIWDIAKNYRADCSDIISVNKLESDILSIPMILLIP